MTIKKLNLAKLAVLIGLSQFTLLAGAEDLRATLFTETDAALKTAREARADLLAPKNFGKAMDAYRDAEENLRRGRSIDSIKKDLNDATAYLRKATDAAPLASITLVSAIQARNDAQEADALKFAAEEWVDAEERFASAAMRLEDGNVNSAKSRAAKAEENFRKAELTAIKANYLDETRRLIAQANDERVYRYAPLTLAKAESLLTQAEKALNENRYDTDEPRSLARQAKYEAKHSIYLANSLEPVRDRDMTLEEYALSNEVPVQKIATALDMVAELDAGYAGPTQAINDRIAELRQDSYQLSERRTQIMGLEGEIQNLESRLGTQSQMLAQQEIQQQRLRQISATFGPDEAEVFTQGENVLIRPIGLVFATGSAQIETQYFSLLRKVQDAVRVFPNSKVVVEGHTDSFGGDATNLTLSESRAKAVREYLLTNMREVSESDVEFIGFGESRPVANNENVEGRAKNRRIDLVIRPSMIAPAAGGNQ